MKIQDEKKLDCFHRKQLKQILMIRWPGKIRNNELCEKKPHSKPVSTEVTKQRWNLLGHPQTRQKKPTRKA